MWQIIHCEIRLVKVRHNTKQARLQGVLWNQYTDPIEDENNVIIYTQNKIKDKYEDKIPFKKRYNMHYLHTS